MTSGPQPREGRVLGMDVGTVRVGLALSDETRTIASPLRTLSRLDRRFWDDICALVAEQDVTAIVVGLPRALDGGEGDSAADARELAAGVSQRSSLRVELWDERFTTVMAESALIQRGMRRRERRARVDAVAASLMLQSWLDAQRRIRTA